MRRVFGRYFSLALMSAAVIVSVGACHTPRKGDDCGTVADECRPSNTPSVATSTTPPSGTPTILTATEQPCDLLTLTVATKYVGDNAHRQLTDESNPPVPIGDDACHYAGDTRTVSVAIDPRPSDPTAPVKHFGVINPEHAISGLSFDAYWFGPAEHLVAVKDGLLVSVSVGTNDAPTWTDQDRADDLELAELIVPQVS